MAPFKALTNAPGGYQQASPTDRFVGDATDMSASATGSTAPRSMSAILDGILAPRDRAIVADAQLAADGTLIAGTDQTTALNDYFLYCQQAGIRPRLPRGPGGLGYLALGTVSIYGEGDYEGRIVAPNHGIQERAVAPSSSVSADRKTITLTGLPPNWVILLYRNAPSSTVVTYLGTTTVAGDGTATLTLGAAIPAGDVVSSLKRPNVPAAAVSADRKTVTITGVPLGHVGTLYANDVSVGQATADAAYVLTWTLGTALAAGATLAYDTYAGPVLSVVPAPGDVVDIPASAVNGWTGCHRGSSHIKGLTGRAGTYVLVQTSDQVNLIRQRGPTSYSNFNLREGFLVNDNEGRLAHHLFLTWTNGSWSQANLIATAQTLRDPIDVSLPPVALYGPARGQRVSLAVVKRCNTTISLPSARNLSDRPVEQGLVIDECCSVTVNEPSLDGIGVDETNYSLALGAVAGVVINNGTITNARRSFDAHNAKDVTIFGGTYPDGLGAHYIWGLTVVGATIGCSTYANPYPLSFAGGDIVINGCSIHLTEPSDPPLPQLEIGVRAVLRGRTDLFELGGNVVFCGGTTIDINATDLKYDPRLISITGPQVGYNTGRTTELPSNIVVDETVRINMRGPTATRSLYLLDFLKNFDPATQTQNLVAPSNIKFSPTITYDNPAFTDNGGVPRCRLLYVNPSQLVGPGPDIKIGNIPDLYVQSLPGNPALAGKKTGRASFAVDIPTGAVLVDVQGGGYLGATVRGAAVTWVDRDSTRQGDESDIQIHPSIGTLVNITRRASATAGATIDIRRDKQLQITTVGNAPINGLTLNLPTSGIRDRVTAITTDSLITGVVWNGQGTPIVGGPPTILPPYSRTEFVLLPDAGGNLVWKYLLPAAPTTVDVITTTGTWIKPPWAREVTFIPVGGGGGGGSGRRGAAGSVRTGGGGGGAGGLTMETYPASELPATLTVEIGAAGLGGAAVTTDNTNGNPGGLGGNSRIVVGGTIILQANGGTPGLGGSTGAASGGVAGAFISLEPPPNGNGGASSATGGVGSVGENSNRAGAGGGAGGGITSGDVPNAGGPSGYGYLFGGNRFANLANGGAAPGGAGGAGGLKSWQRGFGGSGAGGAGGNAAGTVAGGAGGAGAPVGGAGGGGGASTNGANSGAGGDGGRGEVWIIARG